MSQQQRAETAALHRCRNGDIDDQQRVSVRHSLDQRRQMPAGIEQVEAMGLGSGLN